MHSLRIFQHCENIIYKAKAKTKTRAGTKTKTKFCIVGLRLVLQ